MKRPNFRAQVDAARQRIAGLMGVPSTWAATSLADLIAAMAHQLQERTNELAEKRSEVVQARQQLEALSTLSGLALTDRATFESVLTRYRAVEKILRADLAAAKGELVATQLSHQAASNAALYWAREAKGAARVIAYDAVMHPKPPGYVELASSLPPGHAGANAQAAPENS